VLDLFVCPRCHGVLAHAGDDSSCAACGVVYPSIGGISCFVEDPALWRGLWKTRLDDYLATIDRRLVELTAEGGAPNLLDRTRRRIAHVRDAFAENRRTLVELFGDLVPSAEPGVPSFLPGGEQRSGDTPVVEYSENLFRDYVWGQAEAESALDVVRRLASEPLGKTAVYGVGTGRLALDVQRSLGAEQTLGFDIQPLPLLVTARMLRGEEVVLHEYPRAPNSAEATAVRQRLEPPFPKPANVELAFADALRPPLAKGSLDTVITPWFVDATPADVRVTASAINRALRPGGFWLNFGPLRFEGALSRTYAIDEVHEIVLGTSFELGAHFSESVAYFHSPHSGNHRTERIFAFAARKTGEAPVLPAPPLFAPWLSDARLPIPVSPAFAGLERTSILTVGILSMIDGRRSILDIAVALSQQWGVPPAILAAQLRPFLARLPFE
jgi:hypothetical protein